MKDPLFDVSDKIVVITGGLGQIGAEFVREFLGRGSKVAVFSRHADRAKAQKVLGKASDDPSLALYKVDICDKKSIESALDAVEARWGIADVLINNAGIDTQPSAPPEVSGPFEQFPESVFREVVETNLVGTFLMVQAAGARMAAAGKGGSIINVGSIYGMLSPVQDIYAYKKELTGVPFVKPVAYSAAKSGIYNLTRYCATYWAKKGIRVNTLTPSGVWRDTQDEHFHANYCARIPIGRMAQADEYNGAVVFLASDASKYMTGSNLVVDGGVDGMVAGKPIRRDGLYAALFSPYDDEGNLDLKTLRKLVRFEAERGVEGFYCCGSSGEGLLLDTEERMALVDAVSDEIGGKLPFIVHTGALSTRNAVRLSQHAQACGAAAVSMIPPIYYHYTDGEVAAYYEDVVKSVDLGVIVYNIPQFTAISFNKDNPLLQNPKIIGIKHTSMNLYDLERISCEFPEKTIFNGFDEIWLYGMTAGATAAIGTTINICPHLFGAVRKAFRDGDMEKARSLQHTINDFIEVLVNTSVFPAAKYCLTLLGVDVGPCRRPFLPLTEEQKAAVRTALEKIGDYL